ncbi:hypothetical protein [Ornithinimicrobium sp. INDO-MA30-4]|uniref:hypothetical protein n=1 Tax=Ornithinimicrobium sp. INDO-MA30-4 TaxID=2908651 RepID=UPI001F258573|nr:hypothetical protein [Ornithinimicrobium sp. INDO-MA30-4]UJH70736.1 hypothetical protein L0A91_01345 [Ornithinimicrobium sp. INDO-MA30-4]
MTIQTQSADQTRRQLAGESVAAMARNWSPGGPLVGDFYTSNQVFDHDLEVIFGRHWFFATTEAHVRGGRRLHHARFWANLASGAA